MSDLHDAHQTLHTADSLKAAGGQFDDSLSLSSAATTLHKVRLLYPTDVYQSDSVRVSTKLNKKGDGNWLMGVAEVKADITLKHQTDK